MRRRWKWLLGAVAAIVFVAYAVAALIDEPLRRELEQRLNSRLTGYTARIGELDLHPLNFALDLKDVVVVQRALPEPPVASIGELSLSVQWRALLHGRLVGDVAFDRPRINLDLTHAREEARDQVPVTERGWQDAVEAIYPLKINEVRVTDGDFRYVDVGQPGPVHVSAIALRVSNIRNVHSPEGVYPSGVQLEALVHDTAGLRVHGSADFFARPHAALRTAISLSGLELAHLEPMTRHADLELRRGVLSLRGELEYAPAKRAVEVEELVVRDLEADYVRTAAPSPAEQGARKAAAAVGAERGPPTVVRVRRVELRDAALGVVNRAADPPYRIYLDHTHLVVRNVRLPASDEVGTAELTGRFMGSGDTHLETIFRRGKRPHVDLALRVEDTRLPALNEVLRAHAGFDVVAGTCSVYSEMTLHDGMLDGYVKPIIRDLDVYEREQDRPKGLGGKIYETVVGVGGTVFRNPLRGQVATKVDIAGRLDEPRVSTWQAVRGIVRNAFFRIQPGLEDGRTGLRGERR